jgi:serine/threonine-protein kinase RsbW
LPDTRLVMRLEPKASAVPELLDRLEGFAEQQSLPPKVAHRLAVVCEELAANVAMHGAGEGGATYVEIVVELVAGQLRLKIEDDGRPFDPLAEAAPDTELAVEEREIGGLGIHFVRSMVQDITYRRVDTLNRLTAVLDAA